MDAQLKNEIADTIKKVMTVFTAQYTKAYLLALVRLIELESKKEPKEYQLEKRPSKEKADRKSGVLLKESDHLHKWNSRLFVMKPDYTADYYLTEADKEKGKKRGTLNFTGYHVIDDPNQGTLLRLKRLAEKMGMDLSALPKPKEYPPLTFEVHHDRRPCYFLQATNQEEFDAWVKEFRAACWNARGLGWDDWCHQRAYPVALRRTRWEMGRWGYWGSGGSEEQLLTELISDELEYDIMGRVYSKLPRAGPWFIRNKIRNMVQGTIDSMVSVAVKPGWAAMRKAVEALRPELEPKIRSGLEPIFKAKNDIMDKMRSGVMSVLEPLLKEHVNPHLGKIVDIVKSPMREGMEEAMRLFENKIDKWEPKEDLKRSFHELDYLGWSWWEMRTALEKIDVMYEPLWALRLVFSDIYPWHQIWLGHRKIYQTTDNAVYTFEQAISKHEGDKKEAIDPIKRDVLMKFRHDSNIITMNYYAAILKAIVMPPFEALVIPAGRAIIDPLADAIPSALKDFIDIKQMFEDLYNGVIDDCIKVVLSADVPDEAR